MKNLLVTLAKVIPGNQLDKREVVPHGNELFPAVVQQPVVASQVPVLVWEVGTVTVGQLFEH